MPYNKCYAKEKNTILTQGSFDGACLLYALMNAYKALNNKAVSANIFFENEKNKELWKQLIGALKNPREMFNGGGSSNCFGKNEFVKKAVSLFDSTLQFHIKKISIDSLLDMDFTNSVVILCYTENGVRSSLNNTHIVDHWVCATDFLDRSICVQCSYTALISQSYEETKHDISGRYFNRKVSIQQLDSEHIAEDYIYLITYNKAC